MRNLLSFLLKYNNFIVFLILEVIALYMLADGNNYHNSRLVNGVQGITNGINGRINNVRSYLSLREINSKLAEENSKLKDRVKVLTYLQTTTFGKVFDTINRQQYEYTAAKVVNNSVTRQKNYFTIDKGSGQGIKPDMAVTWNNNVAGVIVGCSKNFSVAISLLNLDFKLSARIKSNGYFGSLTWDGRNYRYATLNDIPQHIVISQGDTVECTSYSAIFPESTAIGVIDDFSKSGSDFYKIKVELFTDFKRLYHVDVIGNLKRTEQTELEKGF